ncbi:MAG: hypothetical protein IH840_08415 [Candidatus Heimdallarchaeota archaeon]|nr:hypothetical protein [Candidatus Heimdallarchaeota archaeon]
MNGTTISVGLDAATTTLYFVTLGNTALIVGFNFLIDRISDYLEKKDTLSKGLFDWFLKNLSKLTSGHP